MKAMRVAILALLTGCSLLIPPRMWHPTAEDSDDGRAHCPSYAYPVVDAAYGVPALALGGVLGVAATEPAHDLATSIGRTLELDLALVGLISGALWTASSIYGFTHGASCRRAQAGR